MIRPAAIGLVASREISERLHGRATWLLTGLTTLLAVGLIVVPSLINQQSGTTRVGLVGLQAQAVGPALLAAAKATKVDVTTLSIDSESTARSELTPTQKAGTGGRLARLFGGSNATLDVALLVNGNSATIEAYQTVPATVSALIRAVLDTLHQHSVLAAAGVPARTILSSEAPVPTTIETLQSAPSDMAGRDIAALASGFLLMYSVAGFGSAVATGVAQEKTSRTAELLVAAVRPRELMAGKVTGIGLVGLGQMTVTVGAAMIANALVKSTNIPPELGALLPGILLWFVLGFTLYAFGFAAAGAMVARQEELQSVTMPFTAVLVVGLLLVYGAIASPDSGWIRLLSFLPPLTPVLMPARMILGHTEAWEVALAVFIEIASIVGMTIWAARIYQGALVRGGARLSWSDAFRLGRPSVRSRSVP
jgi:ABC-2 type transport system permease protein